MGGTGTGTPSSLLSHILLLWAKLNTATILLSLGPAAAAAEQTAWRGVNDAEENTGAESTAVDLDEVYMLKLSS